jgi:Ca-activated chloride channel family protein
MDLEEQTPQELAELEELLPVSYLAPEPYEIPALALVFVMDRSGSMGDPAGGVPKIEILKRAALRSLEVLDPEDWVGLIAFDTDFEWIVPLKPLGDRRDFQSSIQRLSANGGTDLYFALKAAFETLERQRAKVKHILVFTDGHNNTKREREYRELYKRFAQSAVRVSVLGIDRAPMKSSSRSWPRPGADDTSVSKSLRICRSSRCGRCGASRGCAGLRGKPP